MPVYPRCAVRPVRGEGASLLGERGERYLAFASGIAVNLLGHGHPHLTKAIQDQAATLMHVSILSGRPQGEAYAARFVETTFADTVRSAVPRVRQECVRTSSSRWSPFH